MAKPVKSQWNFGELFPPEQTRKILSVSELTGQVRRLLEQQVGSIWVTGEVTNLRVQSSGHIYFTLKDSAAQLSCVLFRGEAVAHRELLQDGQKMLLQGDVTVYEARGQYQLVVRSVQLQGIGALQVAFEQLKRKLEAEGLFAAERKRALPRFPERIGLVTSPTGAAIRDVLHVVKRRNPSLEIFLVPCRVQGEGAAREIAEAIGLLNQFSGEMGNGRRQMADGQGEIEGSVNGQGLDLILLTRGGGSLEDLWAFNEEIVARAIFVSNVPIVSAVGHEIDFTISDFVADIRAATPSAAAEIITEGVFSSCQFVAKSRERMGHLCGQQWEGKKEWLEQVIERLARAHPRRKLSDWMQRLDELQSSLSRCARHGTRRHEVAWRHAMDRLQRVHPAETLERRREQLVARIQLLQDRTRHGLREAKSRLEMVESRLRLLGPERVLARGYSITADAKTGAVLRNAEEARAGQRLKTRLKKGEIVSKVEES